MFIFSIFLFAHNFRGSFSAANYQPLLGEPTLLFIYIYIRDQLLIRLLCEDFMSNNFYLCTKLCKQKIASNFIIYPSAII